MYNVNVVALQGLEDRGLITLREHPTASEHGPRVFIANYTPTVQFDKLWDIHPLLPQCRGLIFNEYGDVLARPFPKFFNLGEHVGLLPEGDFEVTEKLDGSLGIMYWLPNTSQPAAFHHYPQIATRGSFESEQAELANKLLWDVLGANCADGYNGDYPFHYGDRTYLFEILGPSNRIVVSYPEDELRLIAVIDNDTGRDMPLDDETRFFDHARRYTATSVEALAQDTQENFEGYVVRWLDTDYRLKVKLDEYLRLHKIMTGVTPRRVWEILSAGDPVEALLERIPDEFASKVRNVARSLESEYRDIEKAALVEFVRLRDRNGGSAYPSRKQFAQFASASSNRDILFALYDDKPYDHMIWKRLRPEGDSCL